MGAQIAAHLTNAGVDTVLFDLAAKERRRQNGIVAQGDRQPRQALACPAGRARRWPTRSCRPTTTTDLELLRGCDLVIEAIAERMDWKQDLYRKIAPFVARHAILASNTSGLSINALAERLPEELRPSLLRRALLQPAALHAPGRADPGARHRPGGARRARRPSSPPRSARAWCAPRTRRTSSATASACSRSWRRCTTPQQFGPRLRRRRCADRPRDRPRRSRRPTAPPTWSAWTPWRTSSRRWPTPCRTIRGTAISRRPTWLEALIAQGRAGPEDRRRHLQQGRQGHPRARSGRRRTTVRRRREGRAEVGRDPEGEGSGRRNSPKLRASRTSAGAVPVGDLPRPVPLQRRTTWPTSPTPRATSTSRSAGASAGSSVRSKPGRPPAGSRSRRWIAEDIAAGKAMSDAPLPAWVFDGRERRAWRRRRFSPGEERASTCRAPRCRSTSASCSPIRCSASVRPRRRRVFENDGVRLWHDGDDVAHRCRSRPRCNTVNDQVLDGLQHAIDDAERNFKAW